VRIVSLLPSATEIACALGFQGHLVGRSHECDYPPGVRTLPVLTRARLDATQASQTIDTRVRELVRSGTSIYEVDAERLRELSPDVILTQEQCEVCAASPRDLEAALADWLGRPPQLISLAPQSLREVWNDLSTVAHALGAPERAKQLTARLEARVAAVAERAGRSHPRPRVACIEWIDPLMAAGNWVPELVALAGGSDVLGTAGAHSPWLAPEALAGADPDVVVVLPCGFDLARTRTELAPHLARPPWSGLRAVREGRVFVTDGNQYFNRPGPRLVESLEILAEIFHPGEFAPAHHETGWAAC